MTRMLKFKVLALLLGIIWLATLGILTVVRANEDNETPVLRGRIVAVNIPGASAISAVRTFLPGGPIHDKPAFAAFTQPGKVLDPARIQVGSTSNFGAPFSSLALLAAKLFGLRLLVFGQPGKINTRQI